MSYEIIISKITNGRIIREAEVENLIAKEKDAKEKIYKAMLHGGYAAATKLFIKLHNYS